jgi:MFS family permease
MGRVSTIFRSLFYSPRPIPQVYKRNFFLLYCDVGFWGILNGSIISFLSIYAARLGASGAQIGLIGAIPAMVTLALAMPTGRWLERRSINREVVRTSVVSRLFYLLLVPLPFILPENLQVWAIMIITLAMTIPGTATTIGFQALLADTVPNEWRAHVAGIRNAVLAVTTTITILVSGQILERVVFPGGYQIIFLLGTLGALLSSMSLGMIKSLTELPVQYHEEKKGPQVDGRIFLKSKMLRLDIIRGKYGLIVGLLFLFHLAQYLPIPIFPLFSVNYLQFSDVYISLCNAVFNFAVFVGSMQLEKVVARLGHHRVVGVGILFLAFYPGILSFTNGLGLYLLASVVGGIAWSLTGGSIYNYIFDHMPATDRPAHLALYNMALNAAILIGSMVGPVIASGIGIVPALALFAVCRFCSGLAILKWG